MADPSPGTVLGGRFTIVGSLGRGGMATVYLADDRVRNGRVALKLLHDHLADQPSMQARLHREVAAASRLHHPGALVAYDLHEIDGHLALSMPVHSGRTLADQVAARGPFDADALERLAADLASVLAEAHRQGVVHRDVTPNNAMIGDDGRAVLTDWGLARVGESRSRTATSALGTSGYAAPEVYEGVRADPRVDLYGLGAVLYFAATGKGPFDASNPMGVLQRQLEDAHTPLGEARPDLPPWLASLVDALLARRPDARPSGARAVQAALADHRAPDAPTAPIAGRAAADPPRAGLATGSYAVIVREDHRDRRRRQALRRGDRSLKHALRQVPAWLGLTDAATPEDALANVVATTAGLPPGVLDRPFEMLEPRFRLVAGVSHDAAQRIAQGARRAGFDARAVDAGSAGSETRPARRVASLMAGLAVMSAIPFVLTAASALLGPQGWHTPPVFLMIGIFPGIGAMLWRNASGAGSVAFDGRPLVYDADLRRHLLAEHRSLADQMGPVDEAIAAAPAADARPEPPSLLDATVAAIDALRTEIEGAAARIPDAAVRDLRHTTGELRHRALAIGAGIAHIEAALAKADPAADQAAIRLTERLERLRTLKRAGEVTEDAEIAQIEASLAAYEAATVDVVADESALSRHLGELLEIGAAIAAARRSLREPTTPTNAARDALRAQVKAAAAAMREVEPGLPHEPMGGESSARPRAMRESDR